MTLTDIISKIVLYAKRAIVNDNSSNIALSVVQSGTGTATKIQGAGSLSGTLEIFPQTGNDFVFDGGNDGVFVFSNTSSFPSKATAFIGANVGINTTNPVAALEVNGAVLCHNAEIFNPAGDTKVEIGGTGNVYLDLKKPNTDDYDLRLAVDSSIASIDIPAGQNLVIAPIGGNVGIGVGTPARKLHVSGLVRLQGLPIYSNNAAAITGGLVVDDVYKTATGELRIVV